MIKKVLFSFIEMQSSNFIVKFFSNKSLHSNLIILRFKQYKYSFFFFFFLIGNKLKNGKYIYIYIFIYKQIKKIFFFPPV